MSPMQGNSTSARLRIRGQKAASRMRRSLLGLLMKLPGQGANDPAALLARFPDEALMPLKRIGLDPVPGLARVRDREPVSRMKMPLGLRGYFVSQFGKYVPGKVWVIFIRVAMLGRTAADKTVVGVTASTS